jgi:hypothetical protein
MSKSILLALSSVLLFSQANAVTTANCPETLYVSVEDFTLTEEVKTMTEQLKVNEVFGGEEWISPTRMSQIVFLSIAKKGSDLGALMKIEKRENGECTYAGVKENSNYSARIDGSNVNPVINVTHSAYLDYGLNRVKFYYKIPIGKLAPDEITPAEDIQSVDIKTEASDVEWGSSKIGSASGINLRFQVPVVEEE